MGRWVVVDQAGSRPLRVMVDGHLDIGRECDGLLLLDDRVSRRHVRLAEVDDRLLVTDLGSSNGTWVDGRRIAAPTTVTSNSTTIRIGATTIRLDASGDNDASVDPPVRATVVDLTAPAERTSTGSGPTASDGGNRPTRPAPATRAGDETVTILFSDIEGSTALASHLGDHLFHRCLSAHNRIVEHTVAEAGGRIVKNQGDGYMVAFRSARRAVLAAGALQHRLHDGDPTMAGLKVRVGCHTGEAILQPDGDLVGQHVIVAARVAEAAGGGQVLVSSLTRAITGARGDVPFGGPTTIDLKGFSGPLRVHQLDWRRLPAPEPGPSDPPERGSTIDSGDQQGVGPATGATPVGLADSDRGPGGQRRAGGKIRPRWR